MEIAGLCLPLKPQKERGLYWFINNHLMVTQQFNYFSFTSSLNGYLCPVLRGNGIFFFSQRNSKNVYRYCQGSNKKIKL